MTDQHKHSLNRHRLVHKSNNLCIQEVEANFMCMPIVEMINQQENLLDMGQTMRVMSKTQDATELYSHDMNAHSNVDVKYPIIL